MSSNFVRTFESKIDAKFISNTELKFNQSIATPASPPDYIYVAAPSGHVHERDSAQRFVMDASDKVSLFQSEAVTSASVEKPNFLDQRQIELAAWQAAEMAMAAVEAAELRER
jgi:hypothetical protein